MKNLIIAILLLVVSTSYAANDQWIISTGSGASYEEAKNIALRNALELAFGTFISSNTVIRNDILQKDEIVGITTGNIKKFNELSKVFINGKYCVTLNVFVSPEKLASFVQSQGMVVEYQGETFVSNIKLMMMMEKTEKQIIQTLADYAKLVFPQCFDFKLKAKDPFEYMTDAYSIRLELDVLANKNFDNLYNHIIKTISEIRLNSEGVSTRVNVGRYPCIIVFSDQNGAYYGKDPRVNYESQFALRTNESRIILWNLFSKDLITTIKNVRISMEAGRYSRDYDFSSLFDFNDCVVINLNRDPNDHRRSAMSVTDPKEFTYITFDRNKCSYSSLGESPGYREGIFAKLTCAVIMKGQNALDAISNIKGFKVIK